MKQKMCEAFLIIKVPLILCFGNVLGKLYSTFIYILNVYSYIYYTQTIIFF